MEQDKTAVIYVARINSGPEIGAAIRRCKFILTGRGFAKKDITEVDLSGDLDNRDRVLRAVGKRTKKTFPIVYINDQLIGDVKDLERWILRENLPIRKPEEYKEGLLNIDIPPQHSNTVQEIINARNDPQLSRSTFLKNKLQNLQSAEKMEVLKMINEFYWLSFCVQ